MGRKHLAILVAAFALLLGMPSMASAQNQDLAMRRAGLDRAIGDTELLLAQLRGQRGALSTSVRTNPCASTMNGRACIERIQQQAGTISDAARSQALESDFAFLIGHAGRLTAGDQSEHIAALQRMLEALRAEKSGLQQQILGQDRESQRSDATRHR